MKIRVLHLGLGRFHKAHQAVYFQRLFEEQAEAWGLVSFSMRSPEASDRLRAVQFSYPVLELGHNKHQIRWISVIKESYFALRDKEKLIFYFCSPDVSLVTLTVTEKAYSQNIFSSESLPSILYRGLRARRQAHGPKLTVLSCDNLRDNGGKLKKAVLEVAARENDNDTMSWISENVKFPNSMVDRIVPALTDTRLEELQHKYNLPNSELTATEFFSQWVIEAAVNQPFPSLQKVGVQIVPEVVPFEEIKLFLLNASHSYLAYAGLLCSYSYVHEAVNDPRLSAELNELHAEILSLLNVPEDFDIHAYIKEMLERFNNPELPHQLRQIAMDGSQKLQQRIFPNIAKAETLKTASRRLKACVDYWVHYCFQNIPDDPLKEEIERMKARAKDFNSFKNEMMALIQSLSR